MSQNLQRIFTENKCDATYHIENDNVTVYAFDDAQVKQALRYVKNNVMQDSLVVDEAAKYTCILWLVRDAGGDRRV